MRLDGGQKYEKQKTVSVVWQSVQMMQEIFRTCNRPRSLLKHLQNTGKLCIESKERDSYVMKDVLWIVTQCIKLEKDFAVKSRKHGIIGNIMVRVRCMSKWKGYKESCNELLFGRTVPELAEHALRKGKV